MWEDINMKQEDSKGGIKKDRKKQNIKSAGAMATGSMDIQKRGRLHHNGKYCMKFIELQHGIT